MTCREVIDVLAEYLASALSPEMVTALETHLAGCAPCVAYLRTYRRTQEIAAEADRVEMPEEMKTRLRAFLLDQLGGA